MKENNVDTISCKGRLLFMDDNDGIRDVVDQMLSCRGYKVSLTANGTEAVDLYQQAIESCQPFDLVIVDLVVFGDMGGETTMRALREIDPHVKVILLSGFINAPMMSYYKERGFSDVINKPVSLEELDNKVQKVMEGEFE